MYSVRYAISKGSFSNGAMVEPRCVATLFSSLSYTDYSRASSAAAHPLQMRPQWPSLPGSAPSRVDLAGPVWSYVPAPTMCWRRSLYWDRGYIDGRRSLSADEFPPYRSIHGEELVCA